MDPYSQILENKYRVKKLFSISSVFARRLLELQERVNTLEVPKEQKKEAPQELGMRVYVNHRDSSLQIFRNVTEVHYRYGRGKRVAFESDIHNTGVNYGLVGLDSVHLPSPLDVVEFEVFPETYIAEAF